ncbi:PHA/PHB synthase family protein [Solirhodobacter olei]|uniref:PHA/PHB synthase family protein n=1 Tax=Solirhodobacter olei TaxID=2493082 RepID=UPI000FDA3055|nr:class I poly(R)-hydroxyalkanoic acid synthase [Solirhodobacter olei]
MTTEQDVVEAKLDRLNANLAKMEELSQRLVAAMAQKRAIDPSLQAPGQDFYMKAATAYFAEMMQNPGTILEAQVAYWGKALKHYVEAQQMFAQGKLEPPEDRGPKDRRFSNPLWDTHPYFNFVKQQYLFSVEAMEAAIAGMTHLDAREKKRVDYFARQIIDMMAPTNFLALNPDALERAVETDGASLVQGLENLVRDLEVNRGDLLVTLADKDAFKVGENLGTTPGAVVYRNRMMELIQYAPTTETVHKTPLIIFPPWINKFYILDLKPQNSLIKWIVDQGFTLFVVSWKNPDPSYRDTGLDDYIREGYLTAMEEVRRICDVPKVNVVGYCIAGTTLSLTLGYMKKKKLDWVKSATFFTTLTDFSDQGEVGVFLDDDFVDGIEREVTESGILDSFFMSRTFSFLRSNDLIYQPAIKSYMMGEAPPAFDLLYWNGDGTNLPARMAVEYLRGLCQRDELAKGTFQVMGQKVSLKDITVPLCAIACETDHIAAWRSSFNGIRQMGAKDKSFILSGSGHIAGIVNPPTKVKYGHYVNPGAELTDPDSWREGAEACPGSWWPHWGGWLTRQSGAKVPPRQPGDSDHRILARAPGTYVSEEPSG